MARTLPAAAQAQIDRALGDAELAYITAGDPGPSYQIFVFGPGRATSPSGPPRVPPADPVAIVLRVCETVVQTVTAVAADQHWPTNGLRQYVERWLTTYITDTHQKHAIAGGPHLEAFRTAVYRTLRVAPFWAQFQTTLRDRATVDTPPSRAKRDSHATLAAVLNALRTEARWSIEELATAVKMQKNTVLHHLDGSATPRLSTIKAYEECLGTRLGHPVELPVFAAPRPHRPARTSRAHRTNRTPKRH